MFQNVKSSYNSVLEFIQKHSDKFSFWGIIGYKLLFDLAYINVIVPVYAYEGISIDFSPLRFIFSFLVSVVIAYFTMLFSRKDSSSCIIMIFINIIYFIPLQSIYAFSNFDIRFYIYSLVFMACMFCFQIKLGTIVFKPLEINKISLILDILSIAVIIFTIYMCVVYSNFRLLSDIYYVYKIRLEASQYDVPTIINYINTAIPTLIPILILRALYNKKYILSILLVAAEYLRFSFDGSKTTFFFLIIVLICWFFYNEKYKPILPCAFAVLALVSVLSYILVDNILITSFFLKRIMQVPVWLSSHFFDYSLSHPLDFFRTGILRRFGMESPYISTIPRVIGTVYQKTHVNANNGLIGDAALSLGFAGAIVYPLIVILILRLIDSVNTKIPQKIIIGVCLYTSIQLTNSTWSTTLLSHGLLICIFILYLFNSEINYKEKRK